MLVTKTNAMELNNRKKIVHKYLQNPSQSYSSIAESLKLPKTTVYCVIKRFIGSSSVDRRKKKSKATPGNAQLVSKVVRSMKQNPGLSLRQRAKRFGTSYEMVRRIQENKGFKTYRAIKVPNRDDKQNLSAKKRVRKLYDDVLTKFKGCLILDDETYVKVDPRQVPGQQFYVANKRLNVADKYKYIKLDKYGKKLMIWQAICSCGGKSRSFVTSSNISSDIYIKECLEKRLLPFIEKHNRSEVETLFWPDLASCHYSKKTKQWYADSKVKFIDRDMNPPNCPEFRPIERYWAIVKKKFKNTSATIKNVKQMQRTWDNCAQKVGEGVVQRLMGSLKRKARVFIRTNEMDH